MGKPEFLAVGSGDGKRDIAYRWRRAAHDAVQAPGLVWLGGYRSDMLGGKAETLDALAASHGLSMLRHDYSGHGESGGDFMEGTISRWLEESLAVLLAFSQGPQILVGSSMGGWIALRMIAELRRRGEGEKAAGLILLAPAPDFPSELTMPRLNASQRAALQSSGYCEEVSPYGPEPTIYTAALFEDAARHQVLGGTIETGCPVHILQGMRDPDVPYEHTLRLLEHLPGEDVTLTLISDGDHRLSRPQDLDRLKSAVLLMINQGR